MPQKAKLDLLEILPDVEIHSGQEIQLEDSSHESSASGGKWALNKILIVAAPAVVILVVAGLSWFYATKEVTKAREIGSPASLSGSAGKEAGIRLPVTISNEQEKITAAIFSDFIIDLKDKTGKSKILMCDVAFDVADATNITPLKGDRTIRNLIYKTVKGKNAVALKSMEERKRLKNELSMEMNKMFGDGFVKNVYFTNFVIM
jgi:flagellar basal body-associated protein FliL